MAGPDLPGLAVSRPKEADAVAISINGSKVQVPDDPRVSLLDLLRERLHLFGTKKGCNQGACGACTVLVDGARVLSCLSLAVQCDGRAVTTIEGLAEGDGLQLAFYELVVKPLMEIRI